MMISSADAFILEHKSKLNRTTDVYNLHRYMTDRTLACFYHFYMIYVDIFHKIIEQHKEWRLKFRNNVYKRLRNRKHI